MTIVIIVSSGVVSSGLTLSSGDQLDVLDGGTTENIAGKTGADELLHSGAIASLTVVSAGGEVSALAGASLISGTILSGGAAILSKGAHAGGMIISSGGSLSGAGTLIQSNAVAGTVVGVTVGEIDVGFPF